MAAWCKSAIGLNGLSFSGAVEAILAAPSRPTDTRAMDSGLELPHKANGKIEIRLVLRSPNAPFAREPSGFGPCREAANKARSRLSSHIVFKLGALTPPDARPPSLTLVEEPASASPGCVRGSDRAAASASREGSRRQRLPALRSPARQVPPRPLGCTSAGPAPDSAPGASRSRLPSGPWHERTRG
jgi:hypothetical protein